MIKMARPQEVMDRANKAWNEELAKHLARGKSYRYAVRVAQNSYDKILRSYDKRAARYK